MIVIVIALVIGMVATSLLQVQCVDDGHVARPAYAGMTCAFAAPVVLHQVPILLRARERLFDGPVW